MISVVLPTYNRTKTLGRAIESVLAQSYKDIELIVVDDASTDNTESLVSEYSDSRIRYIRLQENSGSCAARNAGIIAAKGEYVAFQDSDDYWRPDKLSIQLEAFSNSKADICFSRYLRHSLDDEVLETIPLVASGLLSRKTLVSDALVGTPTLIVRKRVLDEYRFDPNIKRFQDFEWIVRASKDYSVFMCDEILVDIFLQDDSITRSGWQNATDSLNYILCKAETDHFLTSDLESFLLSSMAQCNAMLGKPFRALSWRSFLAAPSFKRLIKALLCQIGIMPLLWKSRKG